ncbi:MAG: hypothetical protein LBT20_07325 [Clostridiales bacterium]|jgi:hypothetical protein|nr:hypothetical protein [Clostridiales bacterium]
MIVNVIKNKSEHFVGKYICETQYAPYESKYITKSVFSYEKNTKNICKFFDKGNVEIASLVLPTEVYNMQFGLTVSFDNACVFLQEWESTGLRCYSIDKGSLKWEKLQKRVCAIYEHDDLLFCCINWASLIIVDAKSGETIDTAFKSRVPIYYYRINNDIIMLYCREKQTLQCYNMPKRKLYTPEIDLGLSKNLETLSLKSEKYTIKNISALGDKLLLKFALTKPDGKDDVVFREVGIEALTVMPNMKES